MPMWKYGFGKTPLPFWTFPCLLAVGTVSQWLSESVIISDLPYISNCLIVMQLLSAQSVSWPNWHSWHSRNSGPSWHSRNSGHSWPSWPSGAGLAHLAVLAYSSSSISKLSNPAVCNSAIYRIYRALWACFKQQIKGFYRLCTVQRCFQKSRLSVSINTIV